MPNIPEYQSSQQMRRTTGFTAPTAEELGAGAGRSLQNLGQTVSRAGQQIESYLERKDIADATKNSAVLTNKYTKELQQREFDANYDTDVVEGLLADYDEEVSSLAEYDTTAGQAEFARLTSQFRSNLALRSTQAQAKRQGIGAVQQWKDTIANYSQATIKDPSLYEMLSNELQSQITSGKGRFANLPATQREDLLNETKQELAGAAAQGIMSRDPSLAVDMAVNGKGPYGEMAPGKQAVYVEKALSNYRTQLQFLQGQEDRDRVKAERQQKDVEQSTSKLMDVDFANGKLTAEKVIANANNLTPEAFKFNLARVTTGREATTDPTLYSDLYLRASAGQDVTAEATRGYHSFNLDYGAYNKIIDAVNDSSGSGVPSKFKDAKEYLLRATKPNEMNPSPGSQFRQAESVAQLMEWMRSNPNASTREAMAEAQAIYKDYAIVDQDSFPINTPTPRFMVGQRGAIDYAETLRATEDAYNKGALNEREYLRQLDLLDKWQSYDERTKTVPREQ